MSFTCNDCKKVITKVSDIRNCSRCQSSGRAASIQTQHQDSDWLTPAIIGYALGGGFSSHHEDSSPAPSMPDFSGGGGDMGGGGSSGSWDSGSSSSDSGSSSSDFGSCSPSSSD